MTFKKFFVFVISLTSIMMLCGLAADALLVIGERSIAATAAWILALALPPLGLLVRYLYSKE